MFYDVGGFLRGRVPQESLEVWECVTITLLHQHQRPLKEKDGLQYIEVTLEDLAAANALAHEVLGRSLDELPPQTRRLLKQLQAMVAERCKSEERVPDLCWFTRRQVREFTGWSNTPLKVHLDRLKELEYIYPRRAGMRGSAYEYELLFDGDTAKERELSSPDQITKPILESYQGWLYRYEKKDGERLSVRTQRARLGTLQRFFSWLCKSGCLTANPAADLELPRKPYHALPKALNREELRRLMGQPDVTDPLGLRDRAILEMLYATGIGKKGACHLLRHSCATHMMENGADLRSIQSILGHARLDPTQIYTEVSLIHLREVYEKSHPASLDGSYAGTSPVAFAKRA